MRFFFLLFFSISLAQAKDVTFEAFKETITPAGMTRASRNVDLLVGAVFGIPASKLNVKIKIANPDNPKNNKYCISVRSRDGLYSANALIAIQNYIDETVQFDLPTQQIEAVNGYKPADFAKLVFEEKGCILDKSNHIIPVFSEYLPKNELRIYVNAPASRIRAQVMQNNKPISSVVSCIEFSEGARVGYTSECRIAVEKTEDLKGISLILLETNQQGQNQTKQYRLSLPKMTQ